MMKIPLRKCVATQTLLPKKDLIRVVLTPEGEVVVDESGRVNGRGAYLQKDLEVIKKAQSNKALDRALKTKISDTVFEDLVKHVS